MHSREIITLGENILAGYRLTYQDALALTRISDSDIPLLAAYAHKIRLQFAGNSVDMCGIINARSGRCPEDCRFCAQSVYHGTSAPIYPLLSTAELVTFAQNAEKQGARRVSLVTSGKGMNNDPDFSRIITALKAVIRSTGLKICANLGTIDAVQAGELAAAGVVRYAHNLETGQRYYPLVCTTHSYQERLKTLHTAREAGMELCCGGIIGMGESWQDRVDLAVMLRDLQVESIPLNILNPIAGTAFAGIKPPAPLEILKTFALFRFILPAAVIRPAGGREINLRDLQGAVMLAGANGLILGHYLTFTGRDVAADFQMVKDAGLTPENCE